MLGQLCSFPKSCSRQDDFRRLGKLINAFIPKRKSRNKYTSLREFGADCRDFLLRCLLNMGSGHMGFWVMSYIPENMKIFPSTSDFAKLYC